MNVWILEVAEPLPEIDGDSRHLRCGLLSSTLVAQGHQVTWWTSNVDHVRKRHRFEGPRSMEIGGGIRLNLLHAPAYKSNLSLHRIWHNRQIASAFEREVQRSEAKPDVLFVCVPILELAEKAAAYSQRNRIPMIADVRDQWPDLYLTAFPPMLRGLARLALTSEFRRAKRVFKTAAGITAVSETYLNWALAIAGRKKGESDGVFPLGYSMISESDIVEGEANAARLRAKHNIPHDAFVVSFVGTFGASYDLETVVRAAETFQVDDPAANIRIVFAGEGDNGIKLREMARGLNNVIFTGWLDRPSLLALLQLSSVGLAAYKAEALQSLPNKPFEYWAAGLPVLSSLGGELEAMIHDEGVGIHYEAGDVSSLASAIRWLSANPEARRAMGARARELMKYRLSAEVVYPKLMAHIASISREGSRSKHLVT